MAWYRNDKAAVAEALRRGERPDLATTMARGPLHELVALHEELGIFAILEELEVQRARAGVPDELLLRMLATLPFVEQASLSGGSEVLFREPAVLGPLGWAPVHIRAGSNGRHRHPEGRQAQSWPCHPDTLRDALRRVGESAWQQAQQAGVQTLSALRSSSRVRRASAPTESPQRFPRRPSAERDLWPWPAPTSAPARHRVPDSRCGLLPPDHAESACVSRRRESEARRR